MNSIQITNKKLFLAFTILLFLNSIVLITLTTKRGAYNLDGSYNQANSAGLIISALIGIIIVIPILCAIISSLIAIFVNRKESYGNRFLKTFLYTLLIVYSIGLVRFTMNLLTL